jgi:hypothetical protein
MKRRYVPVSLAALAWPAMGSAQTAAVPLQPSIAAALEYFYPMYEMARVRYNALFNPANPNRATINRWTHRRQLSDHTSRNVTTPNNDTLYSSSWLDLSNTPVQIRVPPVGLDRYWSIALMDMFTNHIIVLGGRNQGVGAMNAWIVGPAWQGQAPADVILVRAPGNDVWALGRWLINSPDELPAMHALQNSVVLEPVLPQAAVVSSAQVAPLAPSAQQFLRVVNEMIARNPLPEREMSRVLGWEEVGIAAKGSIVEPSLSERASSLWPSVLAAQLAQFKINPREATTRKIGSWHFPPQGIGNFGSDYALRAHIALTGLAALEEQEAVYLQADSDEAGGKLVGSKRYRIDFPSQGFGAQAFWSLSMYELMPDGRMFFTPNALKRFAVGDRTPDLQRDSRGMLSVWIQNSEPTNPAERRNWLPAPAGEFRLMLRAYVPTLQLMRGETQLPKIALLLG